jgi:hypothetical protein
MHVNAPETPPKAQNRLKNAKIGLFLLKNLYYLCILCLGLGLFYMADIAWREHGLAFFL